MSNVLQSCEDVKTFHGWRRNIAGNGFMLPSRYAATDLTFCYLPEDLTLCHLKASEIHLYGAGGGAGAKNAVSRNVRKPKCRQIEGAGFLFVAGAGCFRAGIAGARKPGGACADILTSGICR